MDTRAQVFGFERLGHIVIRAVFHRLQTTLDSCLGGQQNHRNEVVVFIALDELGQLQPVHIRHHQVGHYQIYRLRPDDLFRFCAVACRQHMVVVTEDVGQEITHIDAVINHEDRASRVLCIAFQLLHLVFEGGSNGRRCYRLFIGEKLHIIPEMFLTGMQQDGDGRSLAHFALHIDITVVQVHQLFGEVHTDTRTCYSGVVQLVVAGEALKQHTAFLGRDADTFVLHG